jgi:hypothetical protein
MHFALWKGYVSILYWHLPRSKAELNQWKRQGMMEHAFTHSAASLGDLKLLKKLRSDGFPVNFDLCHIAVQENHRHILFYAMHHLFRVSSDTQWIKRCWKGLYLRAKNFEGEEKK